MSILISCSKEFCHVHLKEAFKRGFPQVRVGFQLLKDYYTVDPFSVATFLHLTIPFSGNF